MTSSQFDLLFSQLGNTPRLMRSVLSKLPAESIAERGSVERFSAVEQAWHLADLEAEGFGPRISRLLSETEPHLADFRGERIAQERRYREKNLLEGLNRFESARAENLARLRAVKGPQWQRSGTQEGVGKVSLSDLPKLMLQHDQSHLREMVELFEDILPTAPALVQLRAALST